MRWLVVLLAMIGKLAITSSYGAVYVFTAEQFPTVIRNVGLGACSTFARIGGVIAPYINHLVSEFDRFNNSITPSIRSDDDIILWKLTGWSLAAISTRDIRILRIGRRYDVAASSWNVEQKITRIYSGRRTIRKVRWIDSVLRYCDDD